MFLLPSVFANSKSLVVNPSTGVKRPLQGRSLCPSGIDSISVGPFMHNTNISKSNIRGNSSPTHTVLVSQEAVGFSCQELH
jgi:hypothetical protein